MLTPLAAGPRQLREFFTDVGFHQDQFQSNPCLRDLPSGRHGNLPAVIESLAAPTPVNILLRWFFAGQAQDRESFEGVLPDEIVEQLIDSGMLCRQGALLVPMVMLTPYQEFLFAADPAHALESAAEDMVLWPNPSTRTLQMFTIRQPFDEVLDLGTGCGMLAILAAQHSRTVVATDLNRRAGEFAKFNAWLNGVSNLECLTGDTFHPVEGRSFDLIMCNPPFFITPTSSQMYCENSMELDDFCRDLIRAAPAYLKESGFLQITLEWVQVTGQAWQDRLSDWLKDTGCDAWVVRSYARSAESYASERIGRMVPYSADAAGHKLEEWQSYYRSRGVEEVHGGVLAMRRRSGSNWVRIEEIPNLDASKAFGEAVLELFHSQDRLEQDRTVEEMLQWRPRLAAEVRLEQQSQLRDGRWRPVSTQLRRTGVLATSLAADEQIADFLRSCDGTRTISELAAGLGRAVKLDPAQVAGQCCGVVRKLVERRLVLL